MKSANGNKPRLSRREEQDMVDRTILKTLLRGRVHWTDLQAIVLSKCYPWATGGRFNARIQYLLKKEYIKRVERGIYEITLKGRLYYEALG